VKPVLKSDVKFDAFRLQAEICAAAGVPLGGEAALDAFAGVTRAALEEASRSATFVYGHRTQAMFYDLVRALRS
jgi:16S rRNA G966 N2-methylase RsmD